MRGVWFGLVVVVGDWRDGLMDNEVQIDGERGSFIDDRHREYEKADCAYSRSNP